jgi:hypothetical protein
VEESVRKNDIRIQVERRNSLAAQHQEAGACSKQPEAQLSPGPPVPQPSTTESTAVFEQESTILPNNSTLKITPKKIYPAI